MLKVIVTECVIVLFAHFQESANNSAVDSRIYFYTISSNTFFSNTLTHINISQTHTRLCTPSYVNISWQKTNGSSFSYCYYQHFTVIFYYTGECWNGESSSLLCWVKHLLSSFSLRHACAHHHRVECGQISAGGWRVCSHRPKYQYNIMYCFTKISTHAAVHLATVSFWTSLEKRDALPSFVWYIKLQYAVSVYIQI